MIGRCRKCDEVIEADGSSPVVACPKCRTLYGTERCPCGRGIVPDRDRERQKCSGCGRIINVSHVFWTFEHRRRYEDPSQHWDVFISYASEDSDLARVLAERLIRSGLRAWFADYEILLTGLDDFEAAIDAGLHRSAVSVLLISDSYIGKQWPEWECKQLLAAMQTGTHRVIPALVGVTPERFHQRYLGFAQHFFASPALLDLVRPFLPGRCLLVFSARLLLMPLEWGTSRVLDAEVIEMAVSEYLERGDRRAITAFQDQNSQAHALRRASLELLAAARRKNEERPGDVVYFPCLADQIPVGSFDKLSVDAYCRRLIERADALGLEHVLWLETPFCATLEAWRKPDINTPDVVHQSLRTAIAATDAPERPKRTAGLVLRHAAGAALSPLYDALLGWEHGDFAVPGPLPAGLAELLVSEYSRLKEVFGNYDHLLISTAGRKDDDGRGPEREPNPEQPVGEELLETWCGETTERSEDLVAPFGTEKTKT